VLPVWLRAGWLRRGLGKLPNPAYLAVTEMTLAAFGFAFGPPTTLTEPVTWLRSQLSGKRGVHDPCQVVLDVRPDRGPIRLWALNEDDEATRVIDLLVGVPQK
jgi:hypothetical protein